MTCRASPVRYSAIPSRLSLIAAVSPLDLRRLADNLTGHYRPVVFPSRVMDRADRHRDFLPCRLSGFAVSERHRDLADASQERAPELDVERAAEADHHHVLGHVPPSPSL